MSQVIVLNRNYEYWTETSIKKVVKWLLNEKIEIIVSHESKEIASISLKIKMPLVVRLINFVGFKPKTSSIPFSQESVFARDNNICQYWHHGENGKFKYKCNTDNRTVDHIIPVSRGGANTFHNTVCACRNCNEIIKRNRTPDEVGLKLIRKPFIPVRDTSQFVIMRFAFNPKKLSHKLYYEQVLGYAPVC